MQSSLAEPFMERPTNHVGASTEHLTRCESTGQLLGGDLLAAQNRYFLHHHSPSHNTVMRRLGSLGDHLQRLQRHNRSHLLRQGKKAQVTSVGGSHTGLRLVKSGVDMPTSASAAAMPSRTRASDQEFALFPPATGIHTADDALASDAHIQVIRGHELLPATCSRFAGKCEACRHTVHATKYSYCRNCPTVCHNSKNCWITMQRSCPALDLAVFGWGEGTQTTSVGLQRELDLEFVFLGGTKPLVANECAECGCVLERRLGYPCDQENSIPDAKLKFKEDSEGRHEENGEKVVAEGADNGQEVIHRSQPAPHRRLRSLLPSLATREGHAGRTDSQQQQVAKRVLACHYTGRYFCEKCHWGDEWYIPGCIFILNDCEKHPVSRTAYLKLRVLWETALIHPPPYWYHDNEEAAKVFRLRTRFQCMSRYFSSCPDAWSVKEIVENSQAPHLLGQPNLLRMADVVDILNKSLYPRLEKKFQLLDSHIRECRMCRSVNRLCCVCRRGKSLFSYDENVGVCRLCDKVFHISCSEVVDLCPTCDTVITRLPST
ncbi:hypothetical protein AAHC03_025971 [Spirometra sp. Aus1]